MVKLSILGDVDCVTRAEYLSPGDEIVLTVSQDEDGLGDGYMTVGITSQSDGDAFPSIYTMVSREELVELAKAIIKLYGDE